MQFFNFKISIFIFLDRPTFCWLAFYLGIDCMVGYGAGLMGEIYSTFFHILQKFIEMVFDNFGTDEINHILSDIRRVIADTL